MSESLRIYIDFRSDFKKEEEGISREDGYIIYPGHNGALQLKMKDFRVDIHRGIDPEESHPLDVYLPVFKEFFTTADPEMFRSICRCYVLNFDLNIFSERPGMSDQDDHFISKYTDWIYFQLDFSFENLFLIEDSCKELNETFHTHMTMDLGWPHTKMFVPKLTLESLSETFQLFMKLITMERSINDEISKTRDKYFKDNKEQWLNTLKGTK